MDSFESVWATIRTELKAGTEISGWSRDKGPTSLRFRVVDVSPGSISVSSSGTSRPRTIGKSDFAKIHEIWPNYCAGSVNRAELGKLSQNTSYIFGIFHRIFENR